MKTSKSQFKSHKIYRWIALFAKIICGPLLAYAFSSYTKVIMFNEASVTTGAFLASICTLVIYYGIIFILNRHVNFETKGPLLKCLFLYIIVVLILMAIEAPFRTTLHNILYKATFRNETGIITIATCQHKAVFLLYGLITTLAFSFVTSHITFRLFKKVLSRPEVLERI